MNAATPGRRHTREDSGIRLDRALRWWHDGEPITHPRIIEAFNTGLKPSDDGRFRLELGNDWCFVEVEDAAYKVLAVDVLDEPKGSPRLFVRLSDRTAETLDLSTLALEEQVLSCRVKGRRAKAMFSRDAQFALGSLMERTGDGVFIRLDGRLFALPSELA